MAQLILSNRLKDMLGSVENFGQTYGNLRQLKLQNERQAKLDAQSKLESDQRLTAGALGIESERADQARKLELRGLESQLGQADAGQVMGPTAPGDFQAVMKDEWAPLKDRISAKIFTMQGQPTVSGDLKTKREDKAIADMRLQTKDKQTAEAHASQLETDKVKREQGNFSPFVLNGNVLGAFDTRRGKVVNTGEQAQPKPGPVGNAKDVVVAGETLIPNMEPIPGVEITKDSVKKTKDAFSTYQSFKNQLTKYTDLVNKQGAELVGEKADEADALVTDLGLKLKELQELGVLTGNDWQLMMKQIPSSTSLGGNAKSMAYSLAGKDAFGPRLTVLNTSVDDKFKNFAETNGFRKATAGAGGTPQSNIATVKSDADFDALPSGAVFIDPDGIKRRKP